MAEILASTPTLGSALAKGLNQALGRAAVGAGQAQRALGTLGRALVGDVDAIVVGVTDSLDRVHQRLAGLGRTTQHTPTSVIGQVPDIPAQSSLTARGTAPRNRMAAIAGLGKALHLKSALKAVAPRLPQMEKYQELKAERLSNATGATKADLATYNALSGKLTEQIVRLGAAVETSLLPAMNAVLPILIPLVGQLADFATNCPTTTAVVVALAAAVAYLPGAISFAKTAWGALSTAFTANPLGLALAALAIGASLIIDNWQAVKGFFLRIWDGVVEHFDTILTAMGPLGWAAKAIIDNWQAVKDFMVSASDAMATAWDAASAKILAVWDKISAPINAVKSFLGLGDAAVPIPSPAPISADRYSAPMPKPLDATDDHPMPGAAMDAAELRGQRQMTRERSTTAGSANVNAAPRTSRIEVLLSLPPGMRAEVKNSVPGLSVIARTGPAMAGAN